MRSPCRRVLLPLIALVALAALPASAHAVPALVSVAPVTAVEGERIRDNDFGGRFTDAGACAAGNYSITVSWGDGTTSPGTIDRTEPFGGQCNYHFVGVHQYRAAGTYATSATVCVGGTCVTGGNVAAITEAAMKGEAFAVNAVAERPFTGEVAEFNDDNRLSQPSDFTAVIDWGDGTTSPGVIGGHGGRLDVSGQHVYARGGQYIVRVTLLQNGVPRVSSDPATANVAPAGSATVINQQNGPPILRPGSPRAAAALAKRGGRRIRRSSLRRGLSLRFTVPSITTRGTVSIVRLGSPSRTIGRVTVRLRGGTVADGVRIATIRVRLSTALRRKLRAGRYELRLAAGNATAKAPLRILA